MAKRGASGSPVGNRRATGGLPPWAQAAAEDLTRELDTDLRSGLSPGEARRRLEILGPNQLTQKQAVSPWRILISQFTDFMVLVLIGAGAISYFLGEVGDAVVILAIVLLNAILGFVQEFRAERAMEKLQELAAPTAVVVRGRAGNEVTIPATEVVPGDIVLLEAGDRVPADIRLVEAHALRSQEAALTGESSPVAKAAGPAVTGVAGIGDLSNAVFLGTEIISGRGRGLVVATGMETQFGQIAGLIEGAGGDPTPLQRRLAELGRYLVLACLLVSGLVVWAGVMRGEELYSMVLAGVSLAVAAIPEGLPAVVTIVLALGVQKMIKRSVIVRKLPAVETLGCATIVCSDKTGTLTENEMTVRRLWTPSAVYAVTGQGYSVRGQIRRARRAGPVSDGRPTGPAPVVTDRALQLLLYGACLCSNADLTHDGGKVGVRGDPTEGALLVAAAKAGLHKPAVEERFPRVDEVPFSSERRRMTTVHRRPGGSGLVAYTKGAADTVLERCTHYQSAGRVLPLTDAERRRILEANEQMAAAGLRVLAVAYRTPAPADAEAPALERDLTLVGLAGMSDPPRPEVKGAIEVCRLAGVKVSMITGDHPATAVAVARELELLDPALPIDRQVVTGQDIEAMNDRLLTRRVDELRVYARVSPGHKLKIVQALKRRGEVVAMTGDGVNDAPAVREADIGVAMGQTGTAVTKEASDMVLVDDNFASIVAALEEGRVIYDNIRRFIRYLLSCNTGEILTMFTAAILGMPLPLLPIQILWVNLVTDGLPAMALGLQAAEDDVSRRPPRHPREGIFARRLGVKIVGRGTIIGFSTIGAFAVALQLGAGDLELARTVAFATLVVSQLVHAFDCRSELRSLVEVPLSSNWYLVGAVGASLAMFLAVLYIPGLARLFSATPLGPVEWGLVLVASAWGQVAVGMRRVLRYQARRRQSA